MNLSIEAATVAELRTKIATIAKDLGAVPEVQATPKVEAPVVAAPEAKEKKTKAKKEAAPVEPPVVSAPTGAVTKETAIEALKTVGTKRSIEAAREILKSMGAEKVSDLPPEQYPLLIDKCNQATANA